MGFLSFKKKKPPVPPPPIQSASSQNIPASVSRPQVTRVAPPQDQLGPVSAMEPMVDILALLEEFKEGLSHLDGRLPSKRLQEQAEKIKRYTDSCIDSGDFELLDHIFTSLEKYNQLTAFPTSGSPADDLRVDLATLRGLVDMSGARSEILELIRDCEDQCSKVLNSPAGESSGLILSEELENIRKLYNQKSSSMSMRFSESAEQLPQVLPEQPVHALPQPATLLPELSLHALPQPATLIPELQVHALPQPATLIPELQVHALPQPASDPLTQTFRLDSEEASNATPVRDETFSDVNRILIETQLSLATMTRDVPSLALVIPRAEELGLALAPAGRKILAEEVLEEALLAFNPLSTDTLLRRLSLAAERAGADSTEATAALSGSGAWKYVYERSRARASSIFTAWREVTDFGIIFRKRKVIQRLLENLQQSKIEDERAADFSQMSLWRRATRRFLFWATFCRLSLSLRKNLKLRTLCMLISAAEERREKRAKNWGKLLRRVSSTKMKESFDSFARLEFSFKLWRRQSVRQKQRVENFWRREPQQIEHLETVNPQGNHSFSIHVSKQGADLVYTTVHAPKPAPLRFPEPVVLPPPRATQAHAPIIEDRWDLEAKRWSVFRSM